VSSNPGQIAHIWRRLGFGPTAADLAHGLAIGPAALIQRLLNAKMTTPTQWALPTGETWETMVEYLGRELNLMAYSPNPLQERMAWILRGLVVVGMVDAVNFDQFQQYTTLLRTNPLGSYTALLRATAVSPAMMVYLNGYQNQVGHPNQNYARELMELFSLGITNPVTGAKNYTQQDVVEVARALTGYTLDWQKGTISFDPTQFDSGSKTFFGVNQGNADLNAVISAVSRHPSYAAFVPARLYRELTGLQPSPATLKQLGTLWTSSGNLRAVVSAIVTSPTFLSPAAIGSKVKTPVELLVSGARICNFNLGTSDYGWLLGSYMNQNPYQPPNVAGWPAGRVWLNAGVTMSWSGIVDDLVHSARSQEGGLVDQIYATSKPAQAVSTTLRLCGLTGASPSTLKALTNFATFEAWDVNRASGLLALALLSPEFAIN